MSLALNLLDSKVLKEVDEFCEKLYQRRDSCDDADGLLFLGDHGMSSVLNYVDVERVY